MTIGETLLTFGAAQGNIPVHGKLITPTSATCGAFKALVRTEPVIDPNMPLGASPIEKMIADVPRSSVPSELLADSAASQVPCTIDGVDVVLTNRNNNPASPFVSFDVVKVT